MQLTPGTLLERGKYRIIETLGRGGFGITYLAEQVMAKRKVCIKEFFPKDYYKRDDDTGALTLSSDGFAESMNKFKAKFVKEAQTIAALDHHNIIPIYDVFEENNTCYYVMEYIEGESLSSIVKESGALSEDVAVGYIKQVASALEHIHARQIMHLDVKPGNIMVRSKDNRAILIDFGLSKHYDATSGEATSTTPVGVSHGYAPMEQYKQGGVNRFSPETDIYSLGATLYYFVTGNVPPQAADIPEEGIVFPTDMSSNIRETIAKSMSYLRKDRPHTIKDFLALLDNDEPIVAVLADESEKTKITQKPAPKRRSNEDKPKQKRSRWWLWLFIAVVVMIVAIFISMSSDRFTPTSNRDSIARVEREKFVRDSTDKANAAAEQKKREEEAEQQRIANMVAQGLGRDGVYQIGDYYKVNGKEGVVFEVWDNGRHGKIVSLDETYAGWDARVEWTGSKYINGTKTGANSWSDGKANTNKIMNHSDSKYFKAFVWCRKKGEDWYLPAVDELKAIYNNKSTINSTLAEHGGTRFYDYYWSSTEADEKDEFCAWNVHMYDGDSGSNAKDVNRCVRAVSTF